MKTERSNTKRLLFVGLIASIITVLLGELPIGWVEYPAVEGDVTGMLGMLQGSGRLSLWQLACGVLFGGLCIPLQYYGFEGMARIVKEGGNPRAARVIRAGAVMTGFFGGIVHVICIGLMFVCRMVEMTAPGSIPAEVMDFALWLVMPISVVFMPVYYAMCIALIVVVAKGKTCLPRWAVAFNPLTATLVLNSLPMLLPASPLVNALNMANMGMGSVLTFGGVLALLSGNGRFVS